MLTVPEVLARLNTAKFEEPRRKKEWEDVYYSMALHISGACPAYRDLRYTHGWIYPKNYFGARFQELFEVSLLARFPREHPDTRDWKLAQYRPWTQQAFMKAIQVITGSIFQDSGYSIVVEDQEDNAYLWGDNFEGTNLINYFQHKAQSICSDPNAYFVGLPREPHYVYATTDGKIEPHFIFVHSKQIRFKSEDEIIFEYGGFTWLVNRVGYYRFMRDGSNFVNADPTGGYYAHMLGYVPAWIAGGLWNDGAFCDGEYTANYHDGFYDSWLVAGWAEGDAFIAEKLNALIVNKDSSAPFIQEASVECPECQGAKRVRIECDNCEGGYELVRCGHCGGRGEVSHNPGDRIIAPVEEMGTDMVKVISTDIEACRFHSEEVIEATKRILRALHLHEIDEAQSAIAKEKDLLTRFQFILRISNDWFDRLLNGMIGFVLSMRNVTTTNGRVRPAAPQFSLVKPTDFQIKTAGILVEEIKAAFDAKVPDYIRAVQLQDYVDKQFGGDDVIVKKSRIINQMDIIAVTTEEDKQMKILNGSITRRDLQFNTHLPNIIDQIIRERGKDWFLAASFDAIKANAMSLFEQAVPSVPVSIQPNEVEVREDI